MIHKFTGHLSISWTYQTPPKIKKQGFSIPIHILHGSTVSRLRLQKQSFRIRLHCLSGTLCQRIAHRYRQNDFRGVRQVPLVTKYIPLLVYFLPSLIATYSLVRPTETLR
jgi:hypothetical protein